MSENDHGRPNLKISVETVAEVQPTPEARTMILEAVGEAGYTELYQDYRLGSAYYVELPRYINMLVERGEQELAREELRRCFLVGGGFPDEVWQRMRDIGAVGW